MNDMWAEKVA